MYDCWCACSCYAVDDDSIYHQGLIMILSYLILSCLALPYLVLSSTYTNKYISRNNMGETSIKRVLLPSTQYSTRYPSKPAAPMVSGGRHFKVTVVSVTSSTTSTVGSLVTADGKQSLERSRGVMITHQKPPCLGHSHVFNVLCRQFCKCASQYDMFILKTSNVDVILMIHTDNFETSNSWHLAQNMH